MEIISDSVVVEFKLFQNDFVHSDYDMKTIPKVVKIRYFEVFKYAQDSSYFRLWNYDLSIKSHNNKLINLKFGIPSSQE